MGANTVLPTKPNTKYVVENGQYSAAGAVVATWKSASTALTGAQSMITGVQHVLPGSGDRTGGHTEGWFETAYGEALVLDLSAAVLVAGCLNYREVVNPHA